MRRTLYGRTADGFVGSGCAAFVAAAIVTTFLSGLMEFRIRK
jgi:hypothetical protein